MRAPNDARGELVWSLAVGRENSATFRFVVDAATGFPIAALRRLASQEYAGFAGFHRFGSLPGSSQVWLRQSTRVNLHEGVLLVAKYSIEDVRFDVSADDTALHVTPSTLLFDQRPGSTGVFHDPATWPDEVRRHVRLSGAPYSVVEDADAPRHDRSLLVYALPAVGVALVSFAGWSLWRRADGRA